VHDAGGGNDLVGRVTAKIETTNRTADVERDGPDVQRAQKARHVCIVEVDLDTAELAELADLRWPAATRGRSMAIRETTPKPWQS
jgi:hypothetical protein